MYFFSYKRVLISTGKLPNTAKISPAINIPIHRIGRSCKNQHVIGPPVSKTNAITQSVNYTSLHLLPSEAYRSELASLLQALMKLLK